jgi:hypothetical protein
MNATTMAVVSALAVMGLAGCTGSFDIDQTEPFRVQLDGAPQTVVVREGAEPREVTVETCPDDQDPCDVEDVEVQVRVEKTSAKPCSILIVIKDESGAVIDQHTIDVGGSNAGMTTTGNATNEPGNTTTTVTTTEQTSGDVVIQNLVVNVRGSKNIVVLTQAEQGDAKVNIQVIKAGGNAVVDADQDSGATRTDTMTTTAEPTNTTTNTTTGP